MKTCPGCGELLGDSVESCFNCNYNYKLKRIVTEEEKEEERRRRQLEREERERAAKQEQEERNRQVKNNSVYEYKTVIIEDYDDGSLNIHEFQKTLDKWSGEGWRLHSVITNELGKISRQAVLSKVNATIDQTIMIFERCIKE